MVDLELGGDGSVICEGCGTELPAFLDECPYCEGNDEDGDDTLPCPECGAEISDLSEQCPICGAWVTPRVPSAGSKPILLWIMIALIVLFVIAMAT